MRHLFLDLDGPLLDVSERHHRLHCDLVRGRGGTPLPRDEYWEAKRARVPEAEILSRTGLSPHSATAVAAARLRRIETRRYLRLDVPWPWTIPTLETLALSGIPLVLVTLRSSSVRLAWQLAALGLSGYFERIIVGAGDKTPEAKAALVRQEELGPLEGSILVGDTEIDIASGQALGIHTVAVRCGIRNEALLQAWSPDVILDDLRALPGCLAERAERGWP
jgi:phosphoglycolate phosphatase-like HAD superfamily hydrolase